MELSSPSGERSVELVSQLAKAGIEIGAADLLDLIDGVNASPMAADDPGWTQLVSENLSAELTTSLVALRETRQAERSPAMNAGAEISSEERLNRLRAVLAERGVDGLILPRADEHQGEYLPPRAERLAWLTGFTGSAGVVVVLKDKAAVFTDGRYTLAIREQVDLSLYETLHVITDTPAKWIEDNLGAGGRLGYDPWLHTLSGVERLEKAAEKAGGALVALDENPIDAIWEDQPPPPRFHP